MYFKWYKDTKTLRVNRPRQKEKNAVIRDRIGRQLIVKTRVQRDRLLPYLPERKIIDCASAKPWTTNCRARNHILHSCARVMFCEQQNLLFLSARHGASSRKCCCRANNIPLLFARGRVSCCFCGVGRLRSRISRQQLCGSVAAVNNKALY